MFQCGTVPGSHLRHHSQHPVYCTNSGHKIESAFLHLDFRNGPRDTTLLYYILSVICYCRLMQFVSEFFIFCLVCRLSSTL